MDMALSVGRVNVQPQIKETQRQFDYIVDNWTDFYIDIIIEQQPKFQHISEKIDKVIQKLTDKKQYICETDLLKLTKIFNDAVYEKYGLDYLLEGIRMMTGVDRSGNGEEYVKLFVFNIKEMKNIKKGCMKPKNIKKIYEDLSLFSKTGNTNELNL